MDAPLNFVFNKGEQELDGWECAPLHTPVPTHACTVAQTSEKHAKESPGTLVPIDCSPSQGTGFSGPWVGPENQHF